MKSGAARSSRSSAQRLHDARRATGGAAGQRLLEDSVRAVGADVQDRADRLALHLRLVVVEQLGQVGERVAAAELAHQVDGRAAHGGVGRALQPLDRRGVRRRRTRSGSRSGARAGGAAPRSTAPRRAAGRSPRRATMHIALTRSNCASSIVARWLMMCRIIEPATRTSIAVSACWRRVRRSPRTRASCTRTPTSCPPPRSRRRAADRRAATRPAASARPTPRRPPRCAADRAAA